MPVNDEEGDGTCLATCRLHRSSRSGTAIDSFRPSDLRITGRQADRRPRVKKQRFIERSATGSLFRFLHKKYSREEVSVAARCRHLPSFPAVTAPPSLLTPKGTMGIFVIYY